MVRHGRAAPRRPSWRARSGAEWRVVFVLGVEEGLLPHWRALAATGEAAAGRAGRSDQGAGGAGAEPAVRGLEEELRLAYVAVTRAREALYLSHCRTRRRGDSSASSRMRA